MKIVTREWRQKADRDYEAAQWDMQKPGVPNYDDVCFHCQQCVEKLMKAVLTERDSLFPKTHDLETLAALVVVVAPEWNYDLDDLKTLAPGAVQYRYPGWDASAQEAIDALAACGRLRASLAALLPQ